jgi:hypothetical protein
VVDLQVHLDNPNNLAAFGSRLFGLNRLLKLDFQIRVGFSPFPFSFILPPVQPGPALFRTSVWRRVTRD